MENVNFVLKKLGAKNGLAMALDENGACTLELSDGRVMLIQERADLDELDFVATLGPVPKEVRAAVFTDLLAANFYWKETFGATISWNTDLDEAVIMYPLALADATDVSVEEIFLRFLDLQSAWAERVAGLVADAQERDGGEPDEEDDEKEAGAAGPGWTAQVEANITTKTAEQEPIEGYLFKCADSLDYTRVGELDEGHFPFLQEPIATPDGFVLPTDTGIRRQLMKEAKLLSELTSPHVLIKAERDRLADELMNLPAGQEFDVKNARLQEIDQQILQSERQQTDTLSNQQIVEMVENAIRSRPQDFPLLTKYYLNAA